jgi:hypothetical protein
LTFLCLVAAAGLAYLWLDKNGQPRNTQWLAPAPIKSAVVATKIAEINVTGSDVAELASALERPIFTPDRKPPSAAPILAAAPPPPDPMASVNLVGLIAGASGGAMVRTDGKVRFISLNQRLGDWTLSSIDDRNASFARAGETRIIKMAYAPLGATNRVAVAATASAAPAPAQAAANSPSPMPEFAKRQAEEAADRKRHLDEIAARFNQKKP